MTDLLTALPPTAVIRELPSVSDVDALQNERGVTTILYGETTGQVIIIAPYLVAAPGEPRALFCNRCRAVTRHNWTGARYECKCKGEG